MKKKTVVDLFCGRGGLSYGFIAAGYDVLLGIDNDIDSLETFRLNHSESLAIRADLKVISANEILRRTDLRKIDVMIGGPPCQGVSLSGHRLRDDPRNDLFLSYLRILAELNPKSFVMENVPGLLGLFGGDLTKLLLDSFEKLGYRVSYKILRADHFGVPQTRKRVFFVGLRNGKLFDFPESNSSGVTTCFEAISDLPEFGVEDGIPYNTPPNGNYQKMMRLNSNEIFNHEATNHKELTKKIISLVPDGGNYKNLPIEFQNTRKVNIAWTRLNSNKPSFTIDKWHRHHFHQQNSRVVGIRTCSLITQSKS